MTDSQFWPETIGRLELVGALAKVCARYVDLLTGATYRAGREQGGSRRGWWVCEPDTSLRADGYRDFSPADQDAAIRKLRAMASADVGTGERAEVEIEPGEQGSLDAFGVIEG